MNYFDLILEQETLSRILTEEKIFEKYFGEPVDFYKSYKNPLRSDNNSGCNFFYGKNTLYSLSTLEEWIITGLNS